MSYFDTMKIRPILLATALSVGSGNALAIPLDFDFSGTFGADNDVALFGFELLADRDVTLFTSSWGEDLGDGDGWVPGGGFDPILTLWDATGTLLLTQNDGDIEGTTASNGVDYGHGVWDAFVNVALDAGDYTVALTQYDNFPVDNLLDDGFLRDDEPFFTADDGFGFAPLFNGVWVPDDPRSGDWELHILAVDSASQVPAGATFALLGIGLAGMLLAGRPSCGREG